MIPQPHATQARGHACVPTGHTSGLCRDLSNTADNRTSRVLKYGAGAIVSFPSAVL